jgi:biotin operon repressor
MKGSAMETTEKILGAMKKAGKPVSAGQLAEATGIDRKEIDKAMKVLKADKRITSPKNCYWEPAK